jgi:hypothetical protein
MSLTAEELRGLPLRRLMSGQKRSIITGVLLNDEQVARERKRQKQREYTRAWLSKPGNAERMKAWRTEWREKNIRRYRAVQMQWRKRNLERVRAQSRASAVRARQKNRDALNAAKRAYYAANREQILAKRRKGSQA